MAHASLLAHTQDSAVSQVDHAPAAGQFLAQAQALAESDPTQAAQLLAQVLDDWGTRMVQDAADPNLFTSAQRLAERVLFQNAKLLAAFRSGQEATAQEMLHAGQLDRVISTRVATMVGLDALLRSAQGHLEAGRYATVLALLDRVSDHDGLADAKAQQHAQMKSAALAQVVPSIGTENARSGTAASEFANWHEIWRVPLEGPALLSNLSVQAQGTPSLPSLVIARPLAWPSADESRIFADDGTGLTAFDRLSGRRIWTNATEHAQAVGPLGPSLNYAAVVGDAVVSYVTQWDIGSGTGTTLVRCCNATTGALMWETALGSAVPNASVQFVPVGQPLVVDGRVVISARRHSAQFESSSWLFCFSIQDPTLPLWSYSLATAGSELRTAVRVHDSPLLFQDSIFVATGTGVVGRVDAFTGVPRWLRTVQVPQQPHSRDAPSWNVCTPAVACGRVFAVAPDGKSVMVLDADSGRLLSELGTGPDSGWGSPQYMTGVAGSTVVAAVGESVAALDAAQPRSPLWTWKTDLPLSGRVMLVPASASRPNAVLIPGAQHTHLVEARTGTTLAQWPSRGNPYMSADQFASAGATSMTSFMELERALALCRAKLAADPTPHAVLPLLEIARLARLSTVAAEGAREFSTRMELDGSVQTAPPPVLLAGLNLLLELDAAGFLTGQDAQDVERVLDAAAVAAGRSSRSALARAERLMRRGEHQQAARELAVMLMEPSDSGLVRVNGVDASQDAHALTRLERAVAAETAAAGGVAAAAVAVAMSGADLAKGGLASSPAELQSTCDRLRRAARVAHAVKDGDATTKLLAALNHLDPSMSRRLGAEFTAAPPVSVGTLDGPGVRSLEFPGTLCRLAPGAQASASEFLTVQGDSIALRRLPEFAQSWRAAFGAGAPWLVEQGDRIVLWVQRPDGLGTALSVSPKDGTLIWQTPPAKQLLGPLREGPSGSEDSSSTVTLPDGQVVPLDQVLPVYCNNALVLVRRDGAMVALDAPSGTTQLWSRTSGAEDVAEVQHDGSSVVVATTERDQSFAVRPRVQAIDARTGQSLLSVEISGGVSPELQWMQLVPGGLLVLGSDMGIEARRLAGGDELHPYWQIQTPDVQYSTHAWGCGPWLLVQTMRNEILAVHISTGRVDPAAFRVADAPLEAVRQVVQGEGWVALVRGSGADFFSSTGQFLGRDVLLADRSISFAIPGPTQLIAIDTQSDHLVNENALQFDAEIFRLQAPSGGKALGAPVQVRAKGSAFTDARAMEGWILLANQATVHAVEFRKTGPQIR
jgi:outer membrane protein assembly factor BamB